MKKIYIVSALFAALLLTACGGKSSHSEHDDHNHTHAHGEEHNHVHGEECTGHSHDAEAEAVHSDEIIFPPEKARAAGVEVETIQPITFKHVIPASGQVLAAQGDESVVVATVPGVVSFKKAITDGMPISKGASILALSSGNMLDGNPAERAKVSFEIAQREYDRAKGLLETKIISEKDFNAIKQEYENARISYEAIGKGQTSGGQLIFAPIGGYIKNVLVNEGDYVEIGQPLVSITQNRRLYLRAEVSERYYKYLHNITSANFKTPYDDQVYSLDDLKGRVLSYGKTSGTTSYFTPITFEFDNKGDIIPGSYVSVYLLASPENNVLALPHTALTEEQGLYFVYQQLDEEGYKKQEVKLGADNGQEVKILSGINAGDRIVVKGAYHVKLASAANVLPAHSHEH